MRLLRMIKEPSKYQIFCDLDGVLVDFYKGIENAINDKAPQGVSERYLASQERAKEALGEATLAECHLNKEDKDFKKPVRDFMQRVMSENRYFWMNLPWMKDGKKLWDFIKGYDPIILSRPVDLQSVIGKKVWVKRNLDLPKERVQIRYDKSKYAKYNGKTGLLIDDYDKNIVAYNKSGGRTIHFKNVDEALAELKEYGFGITARTDHL